MVPAAMGQGAKLSGAETGLLGVKLYDKQIVLIQKFGSPDEVLAVTFGTSSTTAGGGVPGAPGGTGAPAGGPPGAPPGAASAPGGGRGKGGAGSLDNSFPIFGDTNSLQRGGPTAGGPAPMFGPGAPGGGAPQGGGPPGGIPGPGAGGPGSSAPFAGGGASDKVTYTRWVYNRNNNKFGFVIDKFGRIVQIEAIGLENKSLKTRRGIGFGANFAQVMKAYQTPDAYEISGDTITLRYLSRLKVAFRLSRLAAKKPQVVTGIVVAAAKN